MSFGEGGGEREREKETNKKRNAIDLHYRMNGHFSELVSHWECFKRSPFPFIAYDFLPLLIRALWAPDHFLVTIAWGNP